MTNKFNLDVLWGVACRRHRPPRVPHDFDHMHYVHARPSPSASYLSITVHSSGEENDATDGARVTRGGVSNPLLPGTGGAFACLFDVCLTLVLTGTAKNAQCLSVLESLLFAAPKVARISQVEMESMHVSSPLHKVHVPEISIQGTHSGMNFAGPSSTQRNHHIGRFPVQQLNINEPFRVACIFSVISCEIQSR